MTIRRDILVVDDEEFVRDVYGRILRLDGYSFDAVSSGREALSLLEQGRRYAIALVDFVMPGLNGVETARRLKELDAQLQIVFATGSLETDSLEQPTFEARLLLKPFSPTQLRSLLGELRGSLAA